MPLAYVHIVHVMIHLLLVLAPIALYPKVGALTVLLIPLLTLFYHGLLELAMSFLVSTQRLKPDWKGSYPMYCSLLLACHSPLR